MKKGLITSILALTFSGLQAQPLPASPKLVVTLTIDQLRTDYMEAFSSLYGEKGFKRLLREGKVFRQAEFPFCGTDRASAIAAIYTGTTPSMNGIIAEQWLDAGTLRPINCVEDPNFMGNYTDESTSPSQLLTSTIADELKIATRNKGLVYAIAPFRDAAILGAGHAGNGAVRRVGSSPIIRTIPIINFKRQTTKRGGYSLRNILPNRFKYLFYLIKTQYLEYLLYLCFQETLRLT